MVEINNKYNIQIEVLTPLSIGGGSEKDWVSGVDYIVKNDFVYKLSLKKIISLGYDVNQLSTLFVKRDAGAICRILGDHLEEVTEQKFSNVFSSDNRTGNDIKAFIRNQLSNKPIIPGSSIKGSLRSVFFDYLGGNEKNEKEVFGNIKEGNDFMRFVKISDFNFEKTGLVNTKIFNLYKEFDSWKGGWKHSFTGVASTTTHFKPLGFNTVYESLMPEQVGCGTLMLSPNTFNIVGKENQLYGEKKELLLNIDTLFRIINDHTKRYLEKELAFFREYPADKTELIIDGIQSLISMIPLDNSFCIIKMAAGSGFHSITGDWQFDDYYTEVLDRKRNKGDAKPKSRKIAVSENHFDLMGFVKIRIISDDEIRKMNERQKKLEQEELEKAEKIRIAELKEKEEYDKKMSDYDLAIQRGNTFYDNMSYELALNAFREASVIFPEGKQHINRISDIRELLERQAIQKSIDEVRKAEEQQRKERIFSGLSILDEVYELGPNQGQPKVKDFQGVRNRVEKWMKDSDNAVLPKDQIDILLKSLQRVYTGIKKERDKKEWQKWHEGVWKSIEKWIGNDDITKDVYNRIINNS